MRNVFLSAVAAAGLLSTSAQAADLMPVKAPAPAALAVAPSWGGFYVGLFAGYGWGDAKATEPTDPALPFPFYNGTNVPYRFNADGFFGGGTVGYNMQSGAFVYGLEGEVGYLGLRGSLIDPNGTIFFGTPDTVTSFKSGLYGALYGRLGVAADNALFYSKFGVAFLDAKASTIDACGDGSPQCGTFTLTMTGSKVMAGWSAGAGVEWMFSSNWSAKIEYAYFDFGNIGTAGPSNQPGEFYRQTIDVTAHTVKFGVNRRWGGPVVARY